MACFAHVQPHVGLVQTPQRPAGGLAVWQRPPRRCQTSSRAVLAVLAAGLGGRGSKQILVLSRSSVDSSKARERFSVTCLSLTVNAVWCVFARVQGVKLAERSPGWKSQCDIIMLVLLLWELLAYRGFYCLQCSSFKVCVFNSLCFKTALVVSTGNQYRAYVSWTYSVA